MTRRRVPRYISAPHLIETPVTLVCGPPGSGKTTYVQDNLVIGDLVIDVDLLFMALSGFNWYTKPPQLLPFVLEAREAVINRLSRQNSVRHVWVVTAVPSVQKRQALQEQLKAEVVMLAVDREECLRRIQNDDRRTDYGCDWEALVNHWWDCYESR